MDAAEFDETQVKGLKDKLGVLREALVLAYEAKRFQPGAASAISVLLTEIAKDCADLDNSICWLQDLYVGDRGAGARQRALHKVPPDHPDWMREVEAIGRCIPEVRLRHFWDISERTLGRAAKSKRRVPFSSCTPLSDWFKQLRYPRDIARNSRAVRTYAGVEIIKVEAAIVLVSNCTSKACAERLLAFSNSLAVGWMIGGGSYDNRFGGEGLLAT